MLESYVVVDLEMTGLNPKKDKILEVGAVRVKDKKIEETFSSLILQNAPIDESVSKLTGITDEMAATGSPLDVVMESFLAFVEDLPWVGHNIIFDYQFVKQWEVNHRIKRVCYGVDTLKIARKCFPDLEKKTLDYLCEYFSIVRNAKHRALEDALATRELYERLEKRFLENVPELFLKKELQCNVKRQTPATDRQKNYLKDLAKYHKIVLDISPEDLTRSEASRLTDEIILKYGKYQA